jgi:ABC-2 type transport system permease protein
MTAPALTTAAASTTGAPPAVQPTRGAALRLSWRLIRRGALLLWLAVAAYMLVEVLSYQHAYPDTASRQRLLELTSVSAVRMLQGVPGAIDTAGGFAIWDGGWMLSLIVGSWALLTATRLTRGEEDSGRIELVLSRPIAPERALLGSLGALALAVAGIGVAGALPFVALGEPVEGAALWGCGLAGFAAAFVALGVVCAQLVEPRRRAVSVALGVTAVLFLLRIVANSQDRRAWLLVTTPFGWLDRLRAFTDDQWLRLSYFVVVAVALTAGALLVVGRRDAGAALLHARGRSRARLRLLGGAAAFGWRLTSGALVAWAVTLTVSSAVFGLMTGALLDFVSGDPTYRKMLETMGVDLSSPVAGFLSYLALFLALPYAAFVAWRLGTMRQEEADGRLDNLLVRGVVRERWLAATTGLALVAALLLVVLSGAGLWLGAELAGTRVTAWQVVEPLLGTLPLVVLFLGLSVLVFAAAPRLTIGLPVTLAVVGYLLDTFGAMLEWPRWILALSPFHHLARLPGQPMTLLAAAAMTALGLAAVAAGIAVFGRRDLQGA